MISRMVGVVGTAAGGVEDLRSRLVEPLVRAGWTVGVTLTPTARTWLDALGETGELARVSGLVVRTASRLPSEVGPHPAVDVYAVVPATANTVAKLALGIADNQAVTQVCEAIGAGVPVVLFPQLNAAHTGHPAWAGHLSVLRAAGVHLVGNGPPPPATADREPPWTAIIEAIEAAYARYAGR